jgi:serine protease Do
LLHNYPQALITEGAAVVIDAVVKISSGGGARKPVGSGLIVDASGLVAVTDHTLADASDLTVTLKDGTALAADIVGRDPKTDLALLKVKADHMLPSVKFGDSDKLRVGTRIITIGHPQGLDSTVTPAIVTGLHRDIGSGPYDDYIQMDVAYKGMGPVFSLDGEVIGIGTAFMDPPAGSTIKLGFAIPSNQAAVVIDQLRAFGKVRRGWLGARFQELTQEIAESGPRRARRRRR